MTKASDGGVGKGTAVPTGSTADAKIATGGRRQRVGRKRSPAQSNHRAEREARRTRNVTGIGVGRRDKIAQVPGTVGQGSPGRGMNQPLQQTAGSSVDFSLLGGSGRDVISRRLLSFNVRRRRWR